MFTSVLALSVVSLVQLINIHYPIAITTNETVTTLAIHESPCIYQQASRASIAPYHNVNIAIPPLIIQSVECTRLSTAQSTPSPFDPRPSHFISFAISHSISSSSNTINANCDGTSSHPFTHFVQPMNNSNLSDSQLGVHTVPAASSDSTAFHHHITLHLKRTNATDAPQYKHKYLDPRRRSKMLTTCDTLEEFHEKVRDLGFELCASTFYYRLLPQIANTIEGRRHISGRTIPVRLVAAKGSDHGNHPSKRFCLAEAHQWRELASILGIAS